MSGMTFRWTQKPTVVGDAIHRRAAQIVPALTEFAGGEAERMASVMKQNRPWTDRTNAARAGLFGVAEANGTTITIMIGGTTDYTPMLETGTSKMAPRPIIMPTLQKEAPRTIEAAGTLVARIMAGG